MSASTTVLVVEDDVHIAHVLTFMLERQGYQVTHVGDGRAACEHVASQPAPDLVLLDVMLPYVDGFEIVGRIRATGGWDEVPVIMLTAKNTERDTVRALDAGANDFIIKPFQPQELLARLRRFLKTPRMSLAAPVLALEPGLGALGDPILAAAFWTGIAALALTLLLGVQIVRLRVGLRARERRQARTLARWRPILNAAIVGDSPDQLPALLPAERLHFIKLWVHLQASLRGEASAALNGVARRLQLDLDARAMLGRRARTERLLGALMLGHLGEREAWPQLLRLAGMDDPTLSLTALWALVRIDPRAAAEYLTPLFIEREDWAISHVAGILQQASSPVSAVLAGILPRLSPARLPRALRIAEALRVALPDAVLADALAADAVPVVIAALRVANTPAAQAPVRQLLAHQDWQVRVQAVKALGRIGERSDVARLAAMLADGEWWVRYRAARSLVELPFLGRADLEALHASLSDRFAADMLAQVLAETRAEARAGIRADNGVVAGASA